jgi:V8-like Glu-specific endopeptidase
LTPDRFVTDVPWGFARRSIVGLALMASLASPANALPANQSLIVDAMEYPWSAIGRLNIAGRAHCTGFLIGESHALTAARCLYNGRDRRWFHTKELVFVAGYQRDRALIASGVKAYFLARNYLEQRTEGFRATGNSWAILKLASPIGREAGWLGLARSDATLIDDLKAGKTAAVLAGYRREAAHVITANFRCDILSRSFGSDLLYRCPAADGMTGAPLLLFADGKFAAIGIHLAEAKGTAIALSLASFREDGWEFEAAGRPGPPWGAGSPPVAVSPANILPVDTIRQLLQYGLGGSRPDPEAAARPKVADRPRLEASIEGYPLSLEFFSALVLGPP